MHVVEGIRRAHARALIAPEQLKHRQTDRRADIWALGVVAWEFMTGPAIVRCAERRRDDRGPAQRANRCAFAHPEQRPAPLDAIILKELARDPAERLRQRARFGSGLEVFLAGAAIHMGVADWLEELMPGGVGQRQTTETSARFRLQVSRPLVRKNVTLHAAH